MNMNMNDFGFFQMCLVSRDCCSVQMQLLCCFITSAFITLMLLGMRSVFAFSFFFFQVSCSELCMCR